MTIDIIAIVDTETQGLDPKVHRTIELACVLYSAKHATMIEAWSTIISDYENPAESVNRLSAEVLTNHGADRSDATEALLAMVKRADIWVAHRAEFDASFLPDMGRPAVCSKFDIDWPLSKPGASLVEVALAHGVPVHDNHRALTDVLLLAKTFQAAHRICDVQAMLAKAMRPKALYAVADTSYSPERSAQARAAGFAWTPERKMWTRRVAREDAGGFPFAVREVET